MKTNGKGKPAGPAETWLRQGYNRLRLQITGWWAITVAYIVAGTARWWSVRLAAAGTLIIFTDREIITRWLSLRDVNGEREPHGE